MKSAILALGANFPSFYLASKFSDTNLLNV